MAIPKTSFCVVFESQTNTMGSLMITSLIPKRISLRNQLHYIKKTTHSPKCIFYVICVGSPSNVCQRLAYQHSPSPQGLHYITKIDSETIFVM